MRIRILSDIHLEFERFSPPKVKADLIILAGDIDVGLNGIKWAVAEFAPTPVLYILGNHEYYKHDFCVHMQEAKKLCENTNVTILEQDSIEIGDNLFLGCSLWTDFNLFGDDLWALEEARYGMNDYRQIKYGDQILRPNIIVDYHKKSLDWLKQKVEEHKNSNKNIIVITHHAPSILSVKESFRQDILASAYASNLEGFISESNIKTWIHGHTHIASDYHIDTTRVICNPKGYPWQKCGFKPDFFIESYS